MDDAEKKEFGRVLGILNKIRVIVTCPDPRFPNGQWYKAIVLSVRSLLADVFPGEEDKE